jgi:vanillate O-demethylase monooxygenase subunit
MFIRNQWYVAAWDNEVGRQPLARTLLGEPVALYRKLDGTVVAFADACPHRMLPLSMGMVEGDHLRCRYHGVMFDSAGQCVEMPGTAQRLDYMKARTYPVIERYRFVWVWIGEAEQADPALLPDLWACEAPGWAFEGGSYFIKANYKLMIDNLMDLTHETYVHASSIGQKEIDDAPPLTASVDGEVVTKRYMHNITAPPFWRTALRGAGLPEMAPVDRWQVCRFSMPSHVMIDVGVALAGQGGSDAPAAVKTSSVVVDFMTPETETSHWYFWGMARSFAVEDEALTAAIRDGQRKIFGEDLDMLQRQQRNLSRQPGRRLLRLNIDAGGVHARRMIDRAIAAE